jgi:hypothetical protein
MCFCCCKALVGIVSLTLSAAPGAAQTHEFGRVEFENEAVTVVRMHMAPHEKTPMHDIASARLVVWLTDAHLKDTGPDGNVREYNRPAGSIDWVTPRRHMGENLSEHGLDFLAIIPKAAAASGPYHGPPH